jgi:23S rRNA pseudouridine1911/1915/1917 synthase
MNHNLNSKFTSLILPESVAKLRMDQALSQQLPEYSRTQIKLWIDQGHILVNGETTIAKTKVKGGEQITLTIPEAKPLTNQAQAIPLHIVFEDEQVLIINKPVGLIVHPGAGNADQTLLNALLHYHADLAQLPRAGILHRLDKDTSGLLIIAKTPHALQSLSKQLDKRTLEREYQAIVYGHLISGGTVNAAIDRHPLNRTRMAIVETGKPAITHYRIAARFQYHTHLNLKLETGRTHQIRVHMSHIRHPIVGDITYGGRVKLGKNMSAALIQALREFKRQALHAFALGFIHPSTQEYMRITIDLPEDMQNLLHILKQDEQSRVC